MIKVLIADDHQVVLEGLNLLLNTESNIEVVHQVTDGYHALRKLEEKIVDVAVLDIEMPIMNGIEATKLIKDQYPKIKVLILSMYRDENFIRELIQAGASGYILKNKGREELVKAIHTVYNGGEYFGEAITKILINALRNPSKSKQTEEIQLTKREKEVLSLIGKGMSSPEIGKQLFIASTTVDTHRRNLIEKLNVKNSKALMLYAIQNGYMDN